MINPRVDFPGKQLWQTQLRPQTVILKMYGQYRLPYLDGSLEYLERRAQRRADRFRLTTSGGGGRGQSGEMDRTTCVGSPLLWAAYYHLDRLQARPRIPEESHPEGLQSGRTLRKQPLGDKKEEGK